MGNILPFPCLEQGLPEDPDAHHKGLARRHDVGHGASQHLSQPGPERRGRFRPAEVVLDPNGPSAAVWILAEETGSLVRGHTAGRMDLSAHGVRKSARCQARFPVAAVERHLWSSWRVPQTLTTMAEVFGWVARDRHGGGMKHLVASSDQPDRVDHRRRETGHASQQRDQTDGSGEPLRTP